MSLDDVDLHLIESMGDVIEFHAWLNERDRPVLAFDTETTGLSKRHDRVRLVQVGDETTGWAMDWSRWSGVFADVVRIHPGEWTGHNSPFDWTFTSRAGVQLDRRRIHNTRPMAHIIDPLRSTALKKQAAHYVDPRAGNAQTELDEALGKNGGWTWETIPTDFVPYWSYAALDTVLSKQLFDHHYPIIQEHTAKAYEIERGVEWVTNAMELYGVHIDVPYAQESRVKFDTYCREVEEWCWSEYRVKPGSNAKVVQVLAEAGFHFDKATKSGAVSLDEEVLLGIDHPLARQVLQRRKLQKLSSTYLSHYVDEADANGLIYPSINTLGARTSRMSMSEPNLQNLPKKILNNPPARVVRNSVTARPGHTLLFCDFSQIEMRILAWLSQDPALMGAFLVEEDFFVTLAKQVFLDDTITKSHYLRDRVKNVGYAKIYGAGASKIAQTGGIPIEQAQEAFRGWDQTFTQVKAFQDGVYRGAMETKRATGRGYAQCPLTGRLHPADPGKEYALVNYLIQGAAAALFKMKLLELDTAGVGAWMVAPVHDEIFLDVPNEDVEDAVNVLHKVMNDAEIIAPVPVTAEVSYGQRWGEKHNWNAEKWRASVRV